MTKLREVVRAVLDDLEDRRGIKRELLSVREDDPETYAELEATLGRKIQEALSGATQRMAAVMAAQTLGGTGGISEAMPSAWDAAVTALAAEDVPMTDEREALAWALDKLEEYVIRNAASDSPLMNDFRRAKRVVADINPDGKNAP